MNLPFGDGFIDLIALIKIVILRMLFGMGFT
jgi:hypothetical protein